MWQLIEVDPQAFGALAICAGLFCAMTIAWFVIDAPVKQVAELSHAEQAGKAAVSATRPGFEARLGILCHRPEFVSSLLKFTPAPLQAIADGLWPRPRQEAQIQLPVPPQPMADRQAAHWNRLMTVLDGASDIQVRVARLQDDLSHKLDAADFEFEQMIGEVACYSSYAAARVASDIARYSAKTTPAVRLAA